MQTHAFRLKPDDDLRMELERLTEVHGIRAGCILTCVGSLRALRIRTADERTAVLDGPFEVVSLIGTLSPAGCHLHLSAADAQGKVFGGHLKEGCLILTTAEVVIADMAEMTFTRELDPSTGFDELVIRR